MKRPPVGKSSLRNVPKPYADINIRHIVTGYNVSEGAVRRAIELSVEKYCPAHVMLSKAASISTTFEVRSEEPVLTTL